MPSPQRLHHDHHGSPGAAACALAGLIRAFALRPSTKVGNNGSPLGSLSGIFSLAALALIPSPSPAPTSTAATRTTLTKSPYFVGDFETGDLSQWPELFDATNGRVTVVPSPAAPFEKSRYSAKVVTTNAPDSSVLGDGSMVSGRYGNRWEQLGSDTWYRTQFLLPSGINPAYPGKFTVNVSPGQGGWNMLMAWHNPPCTGCPPDYNSSYVGVATGRPRLVFRVSGGKALRPSYRTSIAKHALRYDHWYDVLVRFVYSPKRTVGRYEVWVDRKRLFTGHAPTIYRMPDGSVRGNRFQVGHYRGTTDWTDTVYVDGVRVGPTRTSVGA
jgi:Polysaccharide lyase